MKHLSGTILGLTKKLLRQDESGERAVRYLRRMGVSAAEENEYLRLAEYEVWIEPWENWKDKREAA